MPQKGFTRFAAVEHHYYVLYIPFLSLVQRVVSHSKRERGNPKHHGLFFNILQTSKQSTPGSSPPGVSEFRRI